MLAEIRLYLSCLLPSLCQQFRGHEVAVVNVYLLFVLKYWITFMYLLDWVGALTKIRG